MNPAAGDGGGVAASCHPPSPEAARRWAQEGLWRRRSFATDFAETAARVPDKTAIVSARSEGGEPHRLTYAELADGVERTAAALRGLGVGRQDVVAMQLPNSWEAALLCLAALRCDAIPNPLPTILRRRELEYMLDHAGATVFAVPASFKGFDHAGLALRLAGELDGLEHVIVTEGEVPAGALGLHDDVLGGTAPPAPAAAADPDDVALLLYTSGTTGVPKGALHSHDTLWSAGRALPEAIGLTGDDTCLMASTIGHLTGFYWGTVLPLAMGQTIVYQDVWDPDRALDLVAAEGITWTLSATPFAVDLVKAQRARPRDVGTFATFVCGGAPIPEPVARQVKDVLDVELVALWGMTETGICTMHSTGSPTEVLSASDGFMVDHMDVRIVDDALAPVPAGTEGRLQARGPSICLGYLGRRDLYAAAVTADGWFDTGDLGRQVPDGGVRITGRSKDIIIRGGENLPVAEIEAAVYDHPAVEEVAVVPYPDERLGERVCAVVVVGGPAPDLDDLRVFLAGKDMAKQYWPERLEVVEAMPRTPAGKIQKFRLREWVAAPAMPERAAS